MVDSEISNREHNESDIVHRYYTSFVAMLDSERTLRATIAIMAEVINSTYKE